MRLQHVSLSIPHGGEDAARAFYGALLGLVEQPVPQSLDPTAFIWFELGDPDLELHLMIDGSSPSGRAHICIELAALHELRERLEAASVTIFEATEIVGRPRFFCRDPFGNLLEFTRIDYAPRRGY